MDQPSQLLNPFKKFFLSALVALFIIVILLEENCKFDFSDIFCVFFVFSLTYSATCFCSFTFLIFFSSDNPLH